MGLCPDLQDEGAADLQAATGRMPAGRRRSRADALERWEKSGVPGDDEVSRKLGQAFAVAGSGAAIQQQLGFGLPLGGVDGAVGTGKPRSERD